MVDFFQSRLQIDLPKRVASTITFTAKECPVCKKLTRTLVRPSFAELQSEIGVECGCHGDTKYPGAYVSFQGSFVRDGHVIVETLKGEMGPQGPPGKDAMPPTREELRALLTEVLQEHLDKQSKRFWRFWRKLLNH